MRFWKFHIYSIINKIYVKFLIIKQQTQIRVGLHGFWHRGAGAQPANRPPPHKAG